MTPRARSLLLVAVVLVLGALAQLRVADDQGGQHIDSAFQRAMAAFAIARGLNGVISVAQGTEIAVQPAGVGVNFAPGQILDPVNDLVERFSWIMLLATSSLGIQKILLSMSAWQGLSIGLAVIGVLIVFTLVIKPLAPWRQIVQRLFLFVLILRFMMPAISIANNWVYNTFLQADYVNASAALEEARVNISEINTRVLPEDVQAPVGFIDRARRAYQQALDKVDIDKHLEDYRQAAENISENTIRLVVVFFMQTLIFPLIFLYLVLHVIRRVIRV